MLFRFALASVWLSAALSSLAACGGGQATADSAKSPAAPAASTDALPAASAAPTGDAGSATTTVALGGGGDLQGAKLSETHTVTSTSSSAFAGSNGAAAHGHEPGRGPADIRAIVMAHRDEARACYDNALAAHPGIEGDLFIQWTIDPKGNVTKLSADASHSAISEPTVVACVAAVIQKIQFAPSPGGYESKAFYPFNFRPHHFQKPAGGQ